jgi:hypothetical protein
MRIQLPVGSEYSKFVVCFMCPSGRAFTYGSAFLARSAKARFSRIAFIFAATAAGLSLCGGLKSARAEPSPQQTHTSPASAPSAQNPSSLVAKTDADVRGFRSARFGMTVPEVRAAIKTDFDHGGKIEETNNPVEQTKVLSLDVPALLPNGGAAKVSYVFGYKTKKLIQVSVLWSKATDEKNTPEHLVADGEILRANFVEEDFKKDLVAVNQTVPGGVLLFKGEDANGHTVMVLLPGATAGLKKGQSFKPSSLMLIYIADAKRPDIFKTKHGDF